MTIHAPTSSATSRSESSTSTSTTAVSFHILVTTLLLGTICFALLVLPRASSFSLPPSSQCSRSSSRAATGTKGRKQAPGINILSSLFQTSSVASAETETPSTSTTLVMEEQAGGNSSKRRRKQRVRNIEAKNNINININSSIYSNAARNEEELPDPVVPFDSVKSVKLISLDGSDSDVRVELRLKDGDDSVVIDPRELHQTSDFELWMALRKNVVDVSASQLSVVLGTNYFTSREQLLQNKIKARANDNANANGSDDDDDDGAINLDQEDPTGTGNNGARSNSKACAWGIKMEPLAFAQYSDVMTQGNTDDNNNDGDGNGDDNSSYQNNSVEETGMHLLRHTDPATKKTYIFGASPDGMVTEESREANDDDTTTKTSVGLLEIKSLWGRRHKGSLPEFHNCPSRFYDQIQGQMAICDMEWCDLMLFIPPSGGGTGGSGKKNKRKGKSATKRKKQAAAAAARSIKARKNRGKNYGILRVKRNEKYWNETVLPALIKFCDEVEHGELPTLVAEEEENEVVAA